MKNIKNIICLLLAFALAFSLLAGCSKTGDDVAVSSKEEPTSSEPPSTEEPPVDEEPPVESEDEELWPEDDWEDENFEFDLDEPIVANLEVFNGSKPVIENYHGFTGGVYHAYGFMKDDTTGRVYTDKMMDVELSRLQDTGMKVVRTRYQSQWMWKEAIGYDWNSDRFGYFCDFARAMQERDIEVMIQVGWHFDKMSGHGVASINDVDYLYGNGDDRYGENAGYSIKGLSENDARIVRGARRYGYWIGETLKQLRARGINNANYLSYWVEPCNSYTQALPGVDVETNENGYMPMGHDAREYVLFCRQMRTKLKEMKLDNTVDHMGPNEANTMDTLSPTLKYILDNDPTLFTILSAHHYPQSTDSTNDTYYMYTNFQQEMYKQYLKDAGVEGKVQFWMDEVNCWEIPTDTKAAENLERQLPFIGLQNAVVGMAAQQNGIQNIILWMPFSQLWTDRSSTAGEFKDGIHICGLAPSLFVSSTPFPQYYGTGLFTKYNSCTNGIVYKTNNKYLAEEEVCSVYVSAMRNDDGKLTVTVVNLNIDEAEIHINFEKALGTTLYRHLCATGTLKPDFNATLAPADKTYGNVKDKLTDKLPGGSIAVYTEIVG